LGLITSGRDGKINIWMWNDDDATNIAKCVEINSQSLPSIQETEGSTFARSIAYRDNNLIVGTKGNHIYEIEPLTQQCTCLIAVNISCYYDIIILQNQL
jgi:hypothetical protein